MDVRRLSGSEALQDPVHLHNVLHIRRVRDAFFPHADAVSVGPEEGGRRSVQFWCGEDVAAPRIESPADMLLLLTLLDVLERQLQGPEDPAASP